MSELRDRFSIADEIDTRDLWSEARRRAAALDHLPIRGAEALGMSRWRRLGTAVIAFAVFVAAALFAWEAFHGDVRPPPGPAIEMPPVDLAADLGPGWSELPPPPEVRSKAATAWTGSQLIAWGGYVFDGGGDKTPTDDGFIFDAESRSWEPMPPGPLSARSNAAFAWTGHELLIWGGFSGDCCVPSKMFLDDGAAFDPDSGRWRRLPHAPIDERAPFSAWTGEELIVWGSRDRTARSHDGAAYDPAADTWRVIPDAPIDITDGSAVWTGDELVVVGAALDGNNHAATETDIGAAYNPTTDNWRRIQDSALSPQAVTAAWPGSGEMIAWDYEQATAAYDPRTNTWRDLPRVPLDFAECSPRSVAISGYVFGDFCGQAVMFSAAKERWRDVTREDLRGWVTEPVAAGSAVLVLAHSLKLSDVPGRTFDTKMLAYVPRVAGSTGEDTHLEPFVPGNETVGDEVTMPLVFPDGTEATLAYPSALDLASLGVQPDVSYVYREHLSPQFPIVFLHDPDASLASFVDSDAGSRLVNTSEGGIEIFRARGNEVERRFWIRFELPSWTVLVSVRDQLTSAVTVAGALDLRETSSGFPVLEVSGPIALAEGFGEAGGPQLAFGDGTADPDTVSQLDALILLSPDGCTPAPDSGFSGGYGSTCLGSGNVFASIYGDRDFVTGVIEGLRVEDFRQM